MKNLLFTLLVISLGMSGCGEEIASLNPDTSLDSLFDVMYLPSEGYEDYAQTIPIRNDRPIRVIVDHIGDKDMEYDGNPTPTRLGEPPHYFSDEGGYIFVPNVNNVHWETPGNIEELPQPYEAYYVFRDLEGLPGESFLQGGNAINLRNRVTNMSIGIGPAPNEFAAGSGLPDYNKITIFRIKLDGGNSQLWMNNTKIPGTVNVGNGRIAEMVMGAQNNANHCDFFFGGVKFGEFSQAEHNFIYQKLSERFPPGEFPMKPLADSIWITFENDVFTANYNFVNRLGFEEDVNRTEFIWLYAGNESFPDLFNQQVIPGATGRTMNRLDHPTIFPTPPSNVWTKVLVKVYDSRGNTWRFLEGIWKRDNTP